MPQRETPPRDRSLAARLAARLPQKAAALALALALWLAWRLHLPAPLLTP